jgi:hypothetical protein
MQFSERFEEFMSFFTYTARVHAARAKWVISQVMAGTQLIPTDTHLKNMAQTDQGQVMHFDFGRTIPGSPMYPVPNTAAHLALAVIGESLELKSGIKALEALLHGVAEVFTQDEELFALFAVAELLHRASGRWLDPRLLKTDPLTTERRARQIATTIMEQPNPQIATFIDALHTHHNS